MANLAAAVNADETDWIISADLDHNIDFLTVEAEIVKVTANFPAQYQRGEGTTSAPRIRVERAAGGTTAATHADTTALTPLIPPSASAGGLENPVTDPLVIDSTGAAGPGNPLYIAVRDGTKVALFVEAKVAMSNDIVAVQTSGGIVVFSVGPTGAARFEKAGAPDATPALTIDPSQADADLTSDILQVMNWWGENVHGVTKNGFTYIQAGGAGGPTENAPADAELVAGQMILWFDDTDGAGKLMVKAKTANGTVRTGEVALA